MAIDRHQKRALIGMGVAIGLFVVWIISVTFFSHGVGYTMNIPEPPLYLYLLSQWQIQSLIAIVVGVIVWEAINLWLHLKDRGLRS